MTDAELLRSLLDRAHDKLAADVDGALSELADGLSRIRSALPRNVWETAVREVVRPHPLAGAILASPLAQRSRSKPRGEQPDAILNDMMYALPRPTSSDKRGEAIYRFECELPSIASCRDASARVRRDLTRLAASRSDGRILALACGHLREIDTTLFARFARSARIVAVDADRAAIVSVRRRLIDPRMRTVCADPMAFVEAVRCTGSRFDFIYRIAPDTGTRERSSNNLLATAPALLRRGGTLLTTVLTERRPDAGYLEACLDWWPREYDQDALTARARAQSGCAEFTMTVDRHGVLLLVTLVRETSGRATQIGR